MDMAGTTVADDGLVVTAFTRAVGTLGIAEDDERFGPMMRHVMDTMGESKITVFRALFDGDEQVAQDANAAFEAAYGDLVAGGACEALPGAVETISALRDAGVKVALTTGFAPPTRDAIIDSLGWRGLVDLALSPADVGRGRPFPDLNLSALLRLGGTDVRAMATVGDTAFDVRAGLAAGAGVVCGVLTGAHDRDALTGAGAHHVLGSVADLPGVLDLT